MTTTTTYLRPVAKGVPLGPSDGTQTLWQAKATFPGYRDSDLVNWGLDIPGKPSGDMLVDVEEMHEQDGEFADIYSSLGVDLDKLRLPQDKIKLFCDTQPGHLHPQGYATFFLFTRGDEPVAKDKSNLFVADAYDITSEREVYVYEFSYRGVWRAEYQHRFVLPQQKL